MSNPYDTCAERDFLLVRSLRAQAICGEILREDDREAIAAHNARVAPVVAPTESVMYHLAQREMVRRTFTAMLDDGMRIAILESKPTEEDMAPGALVLGLSNDIDHLMIRVMDRGQAQQFVVAVDQNDERHYLLIEYPSPLFGLLNYCDHLFSHAVEAEVFALRMMAEIGGHDSLPAYVDAGRGELVEPAPTIH